MSSRMIVYAVLTGACLCLLPANVFGQEDVSDWRLLYDKAVGLSKSGKYRQSNILMREIVTDYPDIEPAYVQIGINYYRLGEYDSAVIALSRAVEIDPDDAFAHNCLGNAYIQTGNHDLAINEHLRVLELDSSNCRAHANLGVAYAARGDLRKGQDCLETAISLNPYRPSFRATIGQVLYSRKNWSESIDQLILCRDIDQWYPGIDALIRSVLMEAQPHFRKLASSAASDPWTHYYLAQSCAYGGDILVALREINRAITLDSSQSAFYRLRGRIRCIMHQYGRAMSDYLLSIKVDPADWVAYTELSGVYAVMDRLTESREAIVLAAQLAPDVIKVQAGLGVALALANNHLEALDAFKKADSLGSRDPAVQYNLAATCVNLGHLDQALDYARKSQQMGHDRAESLIRAINEVYGPTAKK